MTLQVAAFVNGTMLGELRIRNQGHPETGGHPADDDLRRYWVELMTPGEPDVQTTTVEHRRSDGWQVLTIQALASLESARTPRCDCACHRLGSDFIEADCACNPYPSVTDKEETT